MNSYVTGNTIRTLREGRKLTQKQLADILLVSDKTVSKWETGRGLPDITLLEPIAEALGVSVAELLSGEFVTNKNRSANMLRTSFYVCPVCGNVIHSTGEGAFSCCGITLPPQQAEEPDAEHMITAEKSDGDYYVTMDHPMSKQHYISFFAYVTGGTVQLAKLYPEQNPEARFTVRGSGCIYAFCNRHGFYTIKVK